MPNSLLPLRRVPCQRLLLTGLLTLISLAAGAAEDRDERFEGMIESLNAPSARRERVVELVYNELRGPHSREMQEALRQALFRSNSLIVMGSVEALALLGDIGDLTTLEALLATTRDLEVKILLIRMLPAFYLGNSERARFRYLRYAGSGDVADRHASLEPLRRPPLNRRGRLDIAQERVQDRIVRALSRQADPVGSAIAYLDDRLFGLAARAAVLHFAGTGLGNDPGRWAAIWENQSGEIVVRQPEDLEEIRLAVMRSLSDMGAEGLPEVIEALRRMLADGGEILEQAVYEGMAAMCRCGFGQYGLLTEMDFRAEDAVEGEAWRRRRLESANNLAIFAAETASRRLARFGADAATFAAAARCLGAAVSFPPEFPVGGGLIAAKLRGGRLLERLLVAPELVREQRAAVAVALGEIGSESAVTALAGILDSPYCAPALGNEGLRLAEAVVDALQDIAAGNDRGRNGAREILLDLLRDRRRFPAPRPEAPPVGIAHLALWRLQRLARSQDTSLDSDLWRGRLGW